MAPRGIRNNNPFNIKFMAIIFAQDPWRGELGLEQHANPVFTTFEDSIWGIRAGAKLLIGYYDRLNLDTVRSIIGRLAPPSENDTNAYVRSVARSVGVEPDEVLNLASVQLELLIKAIIAHENGIQPYDDATIRNGIQLATA